MKQKYIVITFIISLTLSSCGIITKARYGNGLKLNLEFGKDHEKKLSKKSVKVKKMKLMKQDTSLLLTFAENTHLNEPDEASIIHTVGQNETRSSHQLSENNKTISHNHSSTHWNKTKPVLKKIKTDAKSKAPIEPNSKAAGYLFYGSLALTAILSILNIAVPIISIILFLAWLLGFILAIVGLKKIKQSGDKFRGYGLDISIIVISILIVVLSIAGIALAVALL